MGWRAGGRTSSRNSCRRTVVSGASCRSRDISFSTSFAREAEGSSTRTRRCSPPAPPRAAYPARNFRWLSFVSHEYFHAFNVKRLRPVELGPFDYEHPPTTSSLWIAEGFTSYYGDLIVVRAGLGTTQDFLRAMSSDIEQLQNSPGRLVQSLEQSSLDVWSSGTSGVGRNRDKTVNYYVKGPIVGFPARRQDSARDRGQEEPRRRDEAGVQALWRRARLHSRAVPADRARDRRRRSQRMVPEEHLVDGRAGLHRGTRLVRPAIRTTGLRKIPRRRTSRRRSGSSRSARMLRSLRRLI